MNIAVPTRNLPGGGLRRRGGWLHHPLLALALLVVALSVVGMDHDMGGGMATDAEMKEFEQADGAAAEKMFLEMMTAHHQGAIMMVKNGKNADTITMAKNIATSQQSEIATMKKLLTNL